LKKFGSLLAILTQWEKWPQQVLELCWDAALSRLSAFDCCDAFARDAVRILGLAAAVVQPRAQGYAAILYTSRLDLLCKEFDGRSGLLPFALTVREITPTQCGTARAISFPTASSFR